MLTDPSSALDGLDLVGIEDRFDLLVTSVNSI